MRNQASATLTVQTVADDSDWDEHSTVTAALQADDAYTLGDPNSASTEVKDDDFPDATAKLSVTPNPVAEGGTVTVTVTVTTKANELPHGDNGTITISTTDGTATQPGDYESLSKAETLDAGDFAGKRLNGENRYVASYTATVDVKDDDDVEPNETFDVRLAKSMDATKITLGNPRLVQVTPSAPTTSRCRTRR